MRSSHSQKQSIKAPISKVTLRVTESHAEPERHACGAVVTRVREPMHKVLCVGACAVCLCVQRGQKLH